jgi:hypothetical protein
MLLDKENKDTLYSEQNQDYLVQHHKNKEIKNVIILPVKTERFPSATSISRRDRDIFSSTIMGKNKRKKEIGTNTIDIKRRVNVKEILFEYKSKQYENIKPMIKTNHNYYNISRKEKTII